MRTVLAIAIGFGLCVQLGADTYPRQPGIDARHYAVRLSLLTSDSNEIQAVATVTGDLFRFSLGVGVSAFSGSVPAVHQVQMTGRESTFSIPTDAEPAAVVLDPGGWLLAEL